MGGTGENHEYQCDVCAFLVLDPFYLFDKYCIFLAEYHEVTDLRMFM